MPSVYVRVSKIKSWIQQNAPGTQDSDCEAHTLPTPAAAKPPINPGPSSDSADWEDEPWNQDHNDDEYDPGNYDDSFGSWDDDPKPGNPNKWTGPSPDSPDSESEIWNQDHSDD